QLSHHYLATLNDVGDYFISKDNELLAKEILTRALEISNTFNQPYFRMLTHTKLAKIATDKKRYTVAIDHLDQALAIQEQRDIGLVNVVNILIKKASLQAKENHTEEAYQTMQQALTHLGGTPITNPQDITIETFKKQHSSYFIMALKDAAGFYKEMFGTTNNRKNAVDAQYLYELSARVFALYYQNG